jgi:hypothetical protein
MPGHWRWTRRADAVRPASTRGTEALDELLGEVRGLRLTFVADLSTAAGAVEAGAPDIAADILDGDRAELARFFRAADERLRELEQAAHRDPATAGADVVAFPTRSRSHARRRIAVALPAIPLVGALTMAAAAAVGVLPVPGTSNGTAHHSTPAITVENSALRQFASVVNSDPSAQQVIAAADKLHQQIVALMQTSNGDPTQANAIAQLLQAEQALLLSKEPPGAQAVLAASGSLMKQLTNRTKTVITPAIASPPPADVAAQSDTTTSSKSSPSPSPTKSAKPSPTPTHSSSPSPSPSSSSSAPGPLPKVGG